MLLCISEFRFENKTVLIILTAAKVCFLEVFEENEKKNDAMKLLRLFEQSYCAFESFVSKIKLNTDIKVKEVLRISRWNLNKAAYRFVIQNLSSIK